MTHIVYHIASTGSGKGKTRLIELLASTLTRLGVPVAAVKHTPHGYTPPIHDTERYINAGAAIAAAHAPDTYMIIYRRPVSLQELVDELPSPPVIVLAEGYTTKPIGPVIYITDQAPPEKLKPKLYACITKQKQPGCPKTYTWSQIEDLAKDIIKDAEEKLYRQLPGLDCGMCGADCRTTARKLLRGEPATCPVKTTVKLLVDGRQTPLNPYVKRVFTETILALTRTLKGVPKTPKTIKIEINTQPSNK